MSEESKVRSFCGPLISANTNKVEQLCKEFTGLVLHIEKCGEQNSHTSFVESVNTLMDLLILNKINKHQDIELTINKNSNIDMAMVRLFGHVKHLTIHDQTYNPSPNYYNYCKFLSILPKVETLSLIRSKLKGINHNCVPLFKYVDLSGELLNSIAKLVHLRKLKLNGFRIILLDTVPQPALQIRHLILTGGNFFCLSYAQRGKDTFNKEIFELFVTNLAKQFPNIEELTMDDVRMPFVDQFEEEFTNWCLENFVYLRKINLSDSRYVPLRMLRYTRNISLKDQFNKLNYNEHKFQTL